MGDRLRVVEFGRQERVSHLLFCEITTLRARELCYRWLVMAAERSGVEKNA